MPLVHPIKIQIPAITIFLLLFFGISAAEDVFPVQGTVKEDGINIRRDSTVSSEIICRAEKGRKLTIVSQAFDWYKVRLPENAPSYINDQMVVCVDASCSDAKVYKDRVRIRLRPEEISAVLGIARKGQVVRVLAKNGDWYRIRPIENSFAWVHKKFVEKELPVAEMPVEQESVAQIEPVKEEAEPQIKESAVELQGSAAAEKEETEKQEDIITLTGIIKPYGKVFRRKATHKLITGDGETFLLKGDKKQLDGFNRRKVKISGSGTVEASGRGRYPIIEIKNIEEIE